MFSRILGAAALSLGLAACGPQARATLTPVEGDSFLGPADAKVTVLEYGAPTCPACKGWHDMFWAEVKRDYIDAGKIKFVFREFPSHNPPVDAAIFAIARCSGTADWFPLISEAFERQEAIENASRGGEAIPALVELGKEFRLSEAQVQACIKDPKNTQRIYDVQEEAQARGVDSTPTFFINDEPVTSQTLQSMWPEMKTKIDTLLSAGAPAQPAPAPAEPQPAPAPSEN